MRRLLLSSGIRRDNGQSVEASLSSTGPRHPGHPSPKEGQPGAAGRFQRVCLQPPTIHSTDDPVGNAVCAELLLIQLQADAIVPHHSKLKPDLGILKQTSQSLLRVPTGARVGQNVLAILGS